MLRAKSTRKFQRKWLGVFVTLGLAIALSPSLAHAAPVTCDVDGDRDVDRNDVGAIFAARGTVADPGDPRDADTDGMITVNDGRFCVLRCTLPRCAIPPADTNPPTVTPPVDITVAAVDSRGTPATDRAIQAFLNAGTAQDNVDGSLTPKNNAPAVFPLGPTPVTFTATDAAGNSGTATATVTVVDQAAPVVTPPAGITVAAVDSAGTPASDAAIQTFLNAATAQDNVDGPLSPDSNAPLVFPLGPTLVTFTATDAAGNTGTATARVTVVDQTAPVVAITDPASGSLATATPITVSGTIDDPTATVVVNGVPATVANGTFTATDVPLQDGINTLTATATDPAGNAGTASIEVTLATSLAGLPPDPATVAPPVDQTVATTLAAATEFLYTGPNPIQTGIAPGTIEAIRAAVIRGKVIDREAAPLSSVQITILNHPEFGQTLSRADGMFDLAVNGGGLLTVQYEKEDFLTAQRQVNVPWQDYVVVDDVVLIPLDPQVTLVDFNEICDPVDFFCVPPPAQVARGSVVTDEDGGRQATILFPRGTTAEMVLPDGSTQTLNTLSVRATEATVGPMGPKAMPLPLPPTSAYTYAVELSVDEARAAGADEDQKGSSLLLTNIL